MIEPRGTFITFEGPDGSGKTTQLQLLAERLRAEGREVVETVEPGGTDIGRQIRRILLDPANHALQPRAEMLLYFAARAQNVDERIRPALARGAWVLSDRYTDSTLAYQGAGRGLGRDVVMSLHDVATGGLWPDLTLSFDIDLETALERAHARNREASGRDRMDEQAFEFHRAVRESYLQLAGQFPERIRVVDGRGSVETVSGRVWRTLCEAGLHE